MKKIFLNHRSALALFHDALAAGAAWYSSYLLRFNFDLPIDHQTVMLEVLWLVVPIQVIAFVSFGLYKGIWRFASLLDLRRIFFAVTAAIFAISLVLFIFNNSLNVPRSVLILDPILLVLMMGGSRFIYRIMKEHHFFSYDSKKGESVIIVGAGAPAIALVKDLAKSSRWWVAALLDDDQLMHG